VSPLPPVAIAPENPVTPPIDLSARAPLHTWHLSVINAGRPRSDRPALQNVSARTSREHWESAELDRGTWKLHTVEDGQPIIRKIKFGMRGGRPVVGDFNGDGASDVALYHEGQWFIDLNGNGEWDNGDLWAQLGYPEDKPVVGDWDGDGKDDIGIFGRAWPGDPQALATEPGLPDPDNTLHAERKKNLPPHPDATTLGWRELQRTSKGQVRVDLIDHVFRYGTIGDQPIAGNWNGVGSDTIGVFNSGQWKLDIDGDGRFGSGDVAFAYGAAGDWPVVGDFNADGVDEIGVYRGGTWYVDMNGDRILDERDHLMQFGTPGDMPVVGDWDGDGKAEAGVYSADDATDVAEDPKLTR
jgi:hypothetical protein